MRISAILALSMTVLATPAAQQPVQAPPPLVKENATVKLSEHVYAIPDDSVARTASAPRFRSFYQGAP